MKRITITSVQLPVAIKSLYGVPEGIWRRVGFHTPGLYSNFKWALNPESNDWFTLADVKAWICEDNGVPVGMIVASVIDTGETSPVLQGYFSFLEFNECDEVTRTLISTAKEWLWDRGAKKIVGPISLPPMMGYGVMVKGFSSSAAYGTKWRPEWYSAAIQSAGLKPLDHSYGWHLRLKKRNNHQSIPWQPPVDGLLVRRSTSDSFLDDYQEVERLAYVQDQENGRLFSPYEFSRFKCNGFAVGKHVAADGMWVVSAGARVVGGLMIQEDQNPTIKSMNGLRWPFGWLYWMLRPRKALRYRVSMVTLSSDLREVDTLRSLLNHVSRELSLAGVVELEFSQIYKNDREMIAALRGIDAKESKEWVVFEA
jgi:hypothetical protein